MHPFLSQQQSPFQAALEHLHKEFGALRTGRATPALVENVKISAYDSVMELKSVASINVQDAKTILVEPWDKSLIQAIEKGIRDADLGVSPVVDKQTVRVTLPSMTEENRKQLVKIVKEKSEEARIAVRGARENVREAVLKMEKDKAIGEDDKFKMLDELDQLTRDFNQKIEDLAQKKEVEIMTV
jgi:ribosome recycling factor